MQYDRITIDADGYVAQVVFGEEDVTLALYFEDGEEHGPITDRRMPYALLPVGRRAPEAHDHAAFFEAVSTATTKAEEALRLLAEARTTLIDGKADTLPKDLSDEMARAAWLSRAIVEAIQRYLNALDALARAGRETCA